MREPCLNLADGIDVIRQSLPAFVELVARTARWASPAAFRALPLWYPETARGHPEYDAAWAAILINKKRGIEVRESNKLARRALLKALGFTKASNWTVCHIWSNDDTKLQMRNAIVRDPLYFTRIGNMILLPTPLKAFTDSIPEVKLMLRVCAFHTYGWACEHKLVQQDAELVRSGTIPEGYPSSWPRRSGDPVPPGTSQFNNLVKSNIEKRKQELRDDLQNQELRGYPRGRVQEVLDFWKIAP